MSFAYHANTGLLVTLDGRTIALPGNMSIRALANYVQELEALYG